MDLGDLIKLDSVMPALKAKTKKAVLVEMANRAAELTGLDRMALFEILMQREKLSSTGIGRGIAIPHARVASLSAVVGLFARLEEPIDFESLDGSKVDLVFLLLSPEHAGADHLKALARVSRIMRDPHTIEKLRGSRGRAALYSVLTEPLASSAA